MAGLVPAIGVLGFQLARACGISFGRELARDAQRTRILESLGYAVVRVTNLDVYENMDGVLEMIDRTLHPR